MSYALHKVYEFVEIVESITREGNFVEFCSGNPLKRCVWT